MLCDHLEDLREVSESHVSFLFYLLHFNKEIRFIFWVLKPSFFLYVFLLKQVSDRVQNQSFFLEVINQKLIQFLKIFVFDQILVDVLKLFVDEKQKCSLSAVVELQIRLDIVGNWVRVLRLFLSQQVHEDKLLSVELKIVIQVPVNGLLYVIQVDHLKQTHNRLNQSLIVVLYVQNVPVEYAASFFHFENNLKEN